MDRPKAPPAHVDSEDRTQTEERIDAVLKRMLDGKWVTGQSHSELASTWGVTRSAIERYAAEATRIIRRYYRDDPEARAEYVARHCVAMERIARKAEQYDSEKGLSVAIEAHRLLAQLQGVLKHQLDHQVDDHRLDFFRGWTREEKEHFVKTGERPARFGAEPDAGAQ